VRIAGATVHFVDEDVDHGPIILQGAVAVDQEDTPDVLAARILEVEHRIYPAAIQLFADGRLVVEGRRVRIRGPQPPLPPPLVRLR
jgi:phosphoribosylglycinamide formyltransferase-1